MRLGVKGKLECTKEYKKCMAVLIPTIPPFVVRTLLQLNSVVRKAFRLKTVVGD